MTTLTDMTGSQRQMYLAQQNQIDGLIHVASGLAGKFQGMTLKVLEQCLSGLSPDIDVLDLLKHKVKMYGGYVQYIKAIRDSGVAVPILPYHDWLSENTRQQNEIVMEQIDAEIRTILGKSL